MDVGVFVVGLYLVILLFMGFFEWLMPSLTRRDILFGVTVAPNARATAAGRRIIGRFRLTIVLLTLLLAAAIAAQLFLPNAEVWFRITWSASGIIAMLILLPIPYLLAYRASKALAVAPEQAGQPGAPPTPPAPTAELRPRRYGDYVPLIWEIVPLAIIAATVIYLASQYAAAPAIIPQHYDLQGHVNRYAAKSIGSFFFLVWMQLFMEVLLLAVALLTAHARAIPGAADERFRRIWLRGLFGIRTLAILMFGALAAWITANIRATTVAPKGVWFVTVPFLVIVLGGTLALALRTGQGGARLGAASETATDRSDDRYWKLGVFYINPNDPSIFVERRFGVGWTINLGNPRAVLVLVAMLLIPITFAVVLGFIVR
jgi:uncharacterized membrane protein